MYITHTSFLTLQLIENVVDLLCTFWDPQLDGKKAFLIHDFAYIKRKMYGLCVFLYMYFHVDGFGNWSSEGCQRDESFNISDESVTCYCNHLTSFSILLVNGIFQKYTSHSENLLQITDFLKHSCITMLLSVHVCLFIIKICMYMSL